MLDHVRVRLPRLSLAAAVLVLFVPIPVVHAQQAVPAEQEEAGSPPVIEEILVTAQKREQSIRDVPVSLSVLDTEFMKRVGIGELKDAVRYTPNARMHPGGLFTFPMIRGFSTNPLNKGFEQSVGLNIDGIPYGNIAYFESGFFDLQQIEVLRGPQGALFGKNATAGQFNITTGNPTDEFEGYINVRLGNQDRRRVEAAVGGPLIDEFLNFRLALLWEDYDGFMKNSTHSFSSRAHRRIGAKETTALRVKLGFPDLLGSDLILSYEMFDGEEEGAGHELIEIPTQNARNFFHRFDPNCKFDDNDFETCLNNPDEYERESHTFVANWGYDMDGWGLDGWRLDAVAGYSLIKFKNLQETDTTPAPLAFSRSEDDNIQATFELRMTSPSLPGFLGVEQLFGYDLGSTDFLGGLFYQRREIQDSEFDISINLPMLFEFITSQLVPPGTYPTEPLLPTDLGPTETTTGFYEQDGDTFAGFGQVDWHLGDRWTLSYGMRLQYETKDAEVSRRNSGFPVILPASFFEFSDIKDTVRDFQFSPKVSAQYHWTDDITLYGGWAKASKASGFNEFLQTPNRTKFPFDDETIKSWEAGAKMRLFEGTLALNLGFYRSDLDDFQVLTATEDPDTGLGVITIENAGKARVQGVEVDATWLPTDWLAVRGAAAFNRTRFREFPFGSCLMDRINADGDASPECDLSGEPFPRAPYVSYTVTPMVVLPLHAIAGLGSVAWLDGIDLIGSVTVEYQGRHTYSPTLDSRLSNDSSARWDADIGLASEQGWTLRFGVKNLTEEGIGFFGLDVFASAGNITAVQDGQPRLYYGELRWEF